MEQEQDFSVHRRIKELRHSLKLSQVKFAALIFISNGYLAKIELENCPVNDRIISLISSKFGVNEVWLRTGKGQMFKHATQKGNEIDTARMVKVFNELEPVYQDYILKQMEELLRIQEGRANELTNMVPGTV